MKSIRTLTFISLFAGAMHIHAMEQNNNNNNHNAKKAKTEYDETGMIREEIRRLDSTMLLGHDEKAILACVHERREQLLTRRSENIEVSILDKMKYAFSSDILNMLKALGHPMMKDHQMIQYYNGLNAIPITNETKMIATALAQLRTQLMIRNINANISTNTNLFQTFQLRNTIQELNSQHPGLNNLIHVPLAFNNESTDNIMQQVIQNNTEDLAQDGREFIQKAFKGFDHYREVTIAAQTAHPMWQKQ